MENILQKIDGELFGANCLDNLAAIKERHFGQTIAYVYCKIHSILLSCDTAHRSLYPIGKFADSGQQAERLANVFNISN